MIQAESVLYKVPEGDRSIIVGDSSYSCNKFIHNLSKRENVAVITRMRANKTIYEKYEDQKEGSGRKRKYGKNIYLISLIYCLIQTTWKSLKKQPRKGWY